jgi:hypothetical protein
VTYFVSLVRSAEYRSGLNAGFKDQESLSRNAPSRIEIFLLLARMMGSGGCADAWKKIKLHRMRDRYFMMLI